MRAVIDTNVWISAILTPASLSGGIVTAFNRRAFVPVFCLETVEELRSTLSKPRIARRIGLRFKALDRLVATLATTDEPRETPNITRMARDPDDDIFIALAVEAGADYLVTGDKDLTDDPVVRAHLSAAGVELIAVREFIEILEQEKGEPSGSLLLSRARSSRGVRRQNRPEFRQHCLKALPGAAWARVSPAQLFGQLLESRRPASRRAQRWFRWGSHAGACWCG